MITIPLPKEKILQFLNDNGLIEEAKTFSIAPELTSTMTFHST